MQLVQRTEEHQPSLPLLALPSRHISLRMRPPLVHLLTALLCLSPSPPTGPAFVLDRESKTCASSAALASATKCARLGKGAACAACVKGYRLDGGTGKVTTEGGRVWVGGSV